MFYLLFSSIFSEATRGHP